MGEIVAQVELENAIDRGLRRRGRMEESDVRTYSLSAVVDTGAVMLLIPQDVVEHLGLDVLRTVIVTFADERKEERQVAGPLLVKIRDRSMHTDCVVGPPASEALIGQVILEELDLLADCQRGTLVPRPESPIYPMLKLK